MLARYHVALTHALGQASTNVIDVANIVKQDMAMSAKILQMVNSAFFGIRRRVTDVRHAVMLLGMPMIRHLTLTLDVFELPRKAKKLPGFSLEAERNHGLLVGRIARKLLTDPGLAEDAFMAGVLHDVGKLILASHLTETYREVLLEVRRRKVPVEEVEQKVLGVTHAEIGAYLLGLWGVPHPVVEAVAFHHNPSRVGHNHFGILSAVHVANYVADAKGGPANAQAAPRALDMDYLERLGVVERLPRWDQIAQQARAAERSGTQDDE
jgi:HD-like signal output (HDOD) protein